MFAILKKNICISVNSMATDKKDLAGDETEIDLSGVTDPFTVIGKAYINGEFVERELTAEEKQEEINSNNRFFLRNTDWLIIRHKEQIDAGTAVTLTQQEYSDLLARRQEARDEIVDIN